MKRAVAVLAALLATNAYAEGPVTAVAAMKRFVPTSELAQLGQEWSAEGGEITYITHSQPKGGAGHPFVLAMTLEANLKQFEELIQELNIPEVTPTATALKLYGMESDLRRIQAKYPDVIKEVHVKEEPTPEIDMSNPFGDLKERLGNGAPDLSLVK